MCLKSYLNNIQEEEKNQNKLEATKSFPLIKIKTNNNNNNNNKRTIPKVLSQNTFYSTHRPAYLYRFSRDIPILALNHDFPISCGGVPILEDAGIFRACRFPLVLFRRYSRILPASCTYRQSRRCVAAINSPRNAMNQC